MMLEIPEDVAERLKALAKQSDRDVADVLRDMLTLYESEVIAKSGKWATAADLARVAEEFAKAVKRLDIEDNQKPMNTAANSRQILQDIYAEKFRKRADA